jgi:hypothetical protein
VTRTLRAIQIQRIEIGIVLCHTAARHGKLRAKLFTINKNLFEAVPRAVKLATPG